MLKIDYLIGRQLLLSLFFVLGIMTPGLTQAPSPPDNRGLCQLNNISGRSIVDPQGRLVNLVDFCAQQAAQPVEPQAASEPEHSEANPEENKSEKFWRSFTEVASPDAVQFSNTLDRQQVIAYSSTICPYLNNGGTLQQIRQIQARGRLPTSFDVAVTIAAIHAYCPEYTTQIGR